VLQTTNFAAAAAGAVKTEVARKSAA